MPGGTPSNTTAPKPTIQSTPVANSSIQTQPPQTTNQNDKSQLSQTQKKPDQRLFSPNRTLSSALLKTIRQQMVKLAKSCPQTHPHQTHHHQTL